MPGFNVTVKKRKGGHIYDVFGGSAGQVTHKLIPLEKEDINELRERTGMGYTLPIQSNQGEVTGKQFVPAEQTDQAYRQ